MGVPREGEWVGCDICAFFDTSLVKQIMSCDCKGVVLIDLTHNDVI